MLDNPLGRFHKEFDSLIREKHFITAMMCHDTMCACMNRISTRNGRVNLKIGSELKKRGSLLR